MLPSKVYESLRWAVVILPCAVTFMFVLDGAWGLGLPCEAIAKTMSGLEAFLGAIFGFNKLAGDKLRKFSAEKPSEDTVEETTE